MFQMTSQDKKVLCVGLCCLDMVMVCKSFPEEDSDQRCISHVWQRGGNASNNCTIFSEFNVPCEILGTLSNDIGGKFMKSDFEKHHISYKNCHFYEEFESPTSIILINSQNGSRTIVHSNKGMPEVSFEDFKLLNLNNYNWIHFEIRPQYDQIKLIIDYFRLWNSEESHEPIRISIEVEKPRTELLELLNLGDFVFISKDFAQACGYHNMHTSVEGLYPKLRPGASIICAWGDDGAAARSASGPIVTSPAYPPSKLMNTLGAGDTFVAATIIALRKGQDLSEAITRGCQVAGAKCGMHNSVGLSKLFPDL